MGSQRLRAVIAADPEGRAVILVPFDPDETWGAKADHPVSRHFGVWPLSQAALACFGTPDWPGDRPVPQASVEFEVQDAEAVQAAAGDLRDEGFTLLHEARTEPWGQTVARLQSAEGAIIGISFAPGCTDPA